MFDLRIIKGILTSLTEISLNKKTYASKKRLVNNFKPKVTGQLTVGQSVCANHTPQIIQLENAFFYNSIMHAS